MLKLCAIIPKDLTNVLVNLDMLEMEKSALVIIEYHDSFIEFDCIASSDLYLCVLVNLINIKSLAKCT